MCDAPVSIFCVLLNKSLNYIIYFLTNVFKDLVQPNNNNFIILDSSRSYVAILMLGSVSAADWFQSEGWREGLFSQCI